MTPELVAHPVGEPEEQIALRQEGTDRPPYELHEARDRAYEQQDGDPRGELRPVAVAGLDNEMHWSSLSRKGWA